MMKIFKFEHAEGAEIIAAYNAKEAIMFYFTNYQDDVNTDDIVECGGIKIDELGPIDIREKRTIFNEENNSQEKVSYEELAKKHFNGNPVMLVTPFY